MPIASVSTAAPSRKRRRDSKPVSTATYTSSVLQRHATSESGDAQASALVPDLAQAPQHPHALVVGLQAGLPQRGVGLLPVLGEIGAWAAFVEELQRALQQRQLLR